MSSLPGCGWFSYKDDSNQLLKFVREEEGALTGYYSLCRVSFAGRISVVRLVMYANGGQERLPAGVAPVRKAPHCTPALAGFMRRR